MSPLLLNLLIAMCLLAMGSFLFYRHVQRSRLKFLEAELHQTSCIIQRNLQGDIKRKRQEYLGHLIESLTLLNKTYSGLTVTLTDQDRRNMLELCLRQATPLFMGLWEPTRKEEVDLKDIIQNIPPLFAERIHTLNINIDIDIPPKMNSILKWEAVFVEVLLVNVIGKIIYRLPNRGNILISLREEDGDVYLEIRDNGYVLTGTAATLITHMHDFFIGDVALREICRDNGIGYSTTQSQDEGMNVTYLMFPTPQEETANRNIEPLLL